MTHEKVAILDAGSQYGKLIDRRLHELQVDSDIVAIHTSANELINRGYKAIIISGGPKSVLSSRALSFDSKIFKCGLPVLGICYGFQMIVELMGGEIKCEAYREDGQFLITCDTKSLLFSGLPETQDVLLTHGDSCITSPPNFDVLAKSCTYITAIGNERDRIYGVQFHPEVDLTVFGKEILSNFLLLVCKLRCNYSLVDRKAACIEYIKSNVGNKKVLILLSGGVDSTVCCALLIKVIPPERIFAIHIDNGFLRHNESIQVMEALKKLNIAVTFIDACLRFSNGVTRVSTRLEDIDDSSTELSDDDDDDEDDDENNNLDDNEPDDGVEIHTGCDDGDFTTSMSLTDARTIGKGVQVANKNRVRVTAGKDMDSALDTGSRNYQRVVWHRIGPLSERVTNPEEKRRIIGDTFMHVVDEVRQQLKLNDDKFILVQGTLRPDLIESASLYASTKADLIKTHHNDTDLVRHLRSLDRVVEPLRDFHKDEVRAIGRDLGLPESIINRQPFPGPGLAIRIICATEPFMERDFFDTSQFVKFLVGYAHVYDQRSHVTQVTRVRTCASHLQEQTLLEVTQRHHFQAQLLPIRSVGMRGDARSYTYACAISCDNEQIPWESLFILAKLIPCFCNNVNRVTYMFGKMSTDQLEDVTVTLLRQPIIQQLRSCDDAANTVLRVRFPNDWLKLSQMPVVLLPLHFDRHMNLQQASCKRSVVLRPFISSDFMTGLPAVPSQDISEEAVLAMVEEVKRVDGISRVLYDLTAKPPGTTEWE